VQELGRFKQAEVVVQEEPGNMGGWHFAEPYIDWVLHQVHGVSRRPRYAGARRPRHASGLAKHLAQSRRFSTPLA